MLACAHQSGHARPNQHGREVGIPHDGRRTSHVAPHSDAESSLRPGRKARRIGVRRYGRLSTFRRRGDRRPDARSAQVLRLLLALTGVAVSSGAARAPARTQEQVLADWIEADRWFSREQAPPDAEPAVSPLCNAAGVTTADDAAGGCDGVKTGTCGFHTASGETDAWWQVDLARSYRLARVVVYNRTDNNNAARTRHIRLLVSGGTGRSPDFTEVYRHSGEPFLGVHENAPLAVDLSQSNVTARTVRLMVPGRCSFALDEVEVYAAGDPGTNIALGKPADQKSVAPFSKAERKKTTPPQPASEEPGEPDFSLAHTRSVIERGKRLTARLRPDADPERLRPLEGELLLLDRRLADLEKAPASPAERRKAVYLSARSVVRRIAFRNPLLDIDRILFIKRHDPGGLYHMVHQYYGFCNKPGGGLFVLHDPFSDNPTVSDLLADAVVGNGRLQGKRLLPGTFLSPELSFNGRTALFAYAEGEGKGIEWSPRASFHIFRVNSDGTGLVQLTAGRWNDFDPCFLPGGRIVFVSERRGGYLRCGGSAPPYDSPTYTLHSMEPDGSDIICLSFHDTQEWHPSIDHSGMIVYTRWDYVDRDTNAAHHIWTCYPDGRDPRSYHGNYPVRRESRPWMEMSIRAVPGSHRYVATAAAHHGLAFGSLVLIDHRPEDDGAMSQVERLTPDVPFPEAEGGKRMIRRHMVYGTPWPLSEDDYLCVYGRDAGNRGIYWIDRDGNRELLYRDPAISCLSPIPLRPRPVPPAIPPATTQAAMARRTPGLPQPATVAVVNVYDSDFPWPPGVRIRQLRIVQVLPKTTPPANKPRIGVASETNARAVLGTVPVEADGSAYFRAPVGKLLYFQALDEQGTAVQSMRSGTYVHPGEQLTCQGCHEPKRRQAPPGRKLPLALRREASPIKPGPEGSNPFNFPRLVQPVLDRHCVRCHQGEKAVDLRGVVEGRHGWTRSYTNLARKHGFFFTVGNGTINSGVHGGSRTVPGHFGARAAPLFRHLSGGHKDIKLPPEDLHRITLWLDCNSEFYGAYENTAAQARGEIVHASLD